MKISIITPSFNQGQYIEECIQSVLNQNYENFEHIIFDGGSTDNTIDILKKYNHLVWKSEKDRGVSHALNKALNIATGDIIGWINTDDYYLPNTFKSVKKQFNNPSINWIVGRHKLLYHSKNKLAFGNYDIISKKSLRKNCDNIRTNSMFYRKKLFDEIGGFSEDFKMVMDYDLFIRFSQKYDIVNLNDYYQVFRIHDQQITTHINRFRQLKELTKIFLRERLFLAFVIKVLKMLRTELKTNLKKIIRKF